MARTGRPKIEIDQNKPCVYRYVDNESGIIKYVGIVYKGGLEKRLMVHANTDAWALDACWKVEYFECETRSEAEAFESHLITLYGTDKYYNKAKANWGINKYLPDVESMWKIAVTPHFADIETLNIAILIRKLIRAGKREEALLLLDLLEKEETDG